MEFMTGLSTNTKIYDILKNDAKLGEMCKSIYPLVAEEDVKFPFILFSRTSVRPIDTKTCIAGDNVTFDIVIVSDKYKLGVNIAERVRQLFEKRRDSYFREVNMTGCTEGFGDNAYVQTLSFSATILN